MFYKLALPPRVVTHIASFSIILAIALVLRCWNLDVKPLWLDEVITAIFTLGRRYADIPVGKVFPLSDLNTLFSWQGQHNCSFIAESLRTESTHPPLYFCLLHDWLGWLQGSSASLAWKLRSLSVVASIATIPVIYGIARTAFSPAAGVMAAALMAVSPFSVYLAQEARHYTLPMLLVSLSLLGFIQIQQDLFQRHTLRPWVWLGWIAINSLGFYLHYFFLLTFLAQSVTLLGMAYRYRHKLSRWSWGISGLAIAAVLLSYSFWVPQLLAHSRHPATEWAKIDFIDGWVLFSMVLRWVSGWITMLVVFPMENQPLLFRRGMGMLLLLIGLVCFWLIARGIRELWKNPTTRLGLASLSGFIVCIHIAYLFGLYGAGKDISRALRYNFMFYPAAVVLMGASFAHLPARLRLTATRRWNRFSFSASSLRTFVVGLGLVSSMFVISGLAFYKPYFPDQVVQRVTLTQQPLLVVQEYDRPQDLAFGLSLALAMQKRLQTFKLPSPIYWSFIRVGQLSTASLWNTPQGDQFLRQPFMLWSISDRHPVKWDVINFLPMGQIRNVKESSTQTLQLGGTQLFPPATVQATCTLLSIPFELLGTTYHQYQCNPLSGSSEK